MKSNLPNFLIVGAAKCGTSSLHNYLNQHPDVFMPTYIEGLKVKEPRFLISKMVILSINSPADISANILSILLLILIFDYSIH